MKFKSRTHLHEHFKQLEKDGWITSSWNMIESAPKARFQKVFKINFDKFDKK